ncbi:MAG: DsbA family protein [Alphaproteobacteria bacterium]
MVIRLFYIFIIVLAGFLSAQVYYIYSARAHITNIPEGYHFGPANADLTVVEFLDYSCPYCQEVHPIIMEAVEQDGNVKYAPMPILSVNSDGGNAAYLLYAAAKMGKFKEGHKYFIENNTNLVRERLPEITRDLGVDEQEFTTHLDSADVFHHVQDNHTAFRNLKATGTPTFMIGPDILFVPQDGMPSVEDFLIMFEEARAQQ